MKSGKIVLIGATRFPHSSASSSATATQPVRSAPKSPCSNCSPARLFLTRFLDGAKAGEAFLDVRRDLLARGNPLGIVYTLCAVAELAMVQ
jgi:hypothetical protein